MRMRLRRGDHAAYPGQTLVIFALASTLLLAGLGLVLDAGYDFAQRRVMQNAADAAALAGAQLLAQNANTTAMLATVSAVAVQNGVPSSANVGCVYITDGNPNGVAACQANTAPPTGYGTITGVKVTVNEQHGTFAMRVVGIPTSGTGATAATQLQVLGGYSGGGVPFVPCGLNTYLVSGDNFSILNTQQVQVDTDKKGNPIYQTQILNDANGYASINTDAYAYDWDGSLGLGLPKPGPGVAPATGKPFFLIHGSQVQTCGATSDNFKGLNNTTGTISLPAKAYGTGSPQQTIDVDNGVKAGPTRSRRVPGVYGCDVDIYDGCIMVLPVVDNSGPGGTGTHIQYAGRLWAAFWIKQISANEHGGYLIANYPITADGDSGWTPSYTGPVIPRLLR